MGIRSGGFNAIERETVFRLRELFSRGREASVQKMSQEDAAFVETAAVLWGGSRRCRILQACQTALFQIQYPQADYLRGCG